MRLSPYLSFNGECEEAFKFYERCLGGKIDGMMTYAETPAGEQVPPGWRDKIVHMSLIVGDMLLMGSDTQPAVYQKPQGIWVSLHFTDPDEAERVFKALAENGSVHLAFAKTFWSPGFGMCVDRFGIPWMINCLRVA
jgi:PhnB protein